MEDVMDKQKIRIRGACEHNLQSISLDIPKNKLVVITGPSGSGKSSLAIDTLYAEGKRRYVESLSTYARQFLGVHKRPHVEKIEGLCPAIAINQKTVGYNPRSTVGTTTEIYDYLRVLFARIGKPHCPSCGIAIRKESPELITKMLLEKLHGTMITLFAPIAYQKRGEFKNELQGLFEKGFYRFSIDGKLRRFTDSKQITALRLAKRVPHTIDVILDRLQVHGDEQQRMQEGIEKAFSLARGLCKIVDQGAKERMYSSERICLKCARSFPELEPRFFSFNSPVGACQKCHGLGFLHEWPWNRNDKDYWKSRYPDHFGRYAKKITCRSCQGKRLRPEALAVTVGGKTIMDLCELSIEALVLFFENLCVPAGLSEIAAPALREITSRLNFLLNVGLSYLTLSRTARTLSGGESQRIRLATQLGSSLSGVLYILDEPSIGLHQRDNARLIATLKTLRDQGNTVLVVEHDMDTIRQADYLIDMGPQAGRLGGTVTAVGTPKQLSALSNSLTGAYLAGKREIVVPQARRKPHDYIVLKGARANNLKNITVKFPLDLFCVVTGVSGSGKSSLVTQTFAPALQARLDRGYPMSNVYDGISGVEQIQSLVVVDQSPIGRTPRSNPATYVGIFDEIRKLYASLPESNARGYQPGRFSFNVDVGRCFECNGEGKIKVSMHFLEDVEMICKICNGKRYNKQTLEITYKEKSIYDVLDMTVLEACLFFQNFSRINKRLQLLCDVGLDYLKLGQPSTTLSGGEAQRIKLVNELAKRGNRTLYILDEPTTGLHHVDIEKLLAVLNRLVDRGNTVIVIEHNLEVIKSADYVIDIGPEGGDAGGHIVATGTPEKVSQFKYSHTGKFLKQMFG
jgi:excinuclease ABC subunit A